MSNTNDKKLATEEQTKAIKKVKKTKKEKKAKQEKPPKGWIRWSGLGLFIAIAGGIFAIGYFSLTLMLKNQIENHASDAWGAKIEIGSLDIGILPLRIGVFDLEITDPEKPMENTLQVGKIGASLSFYHLVVGRTVIEEIAVTELAFNQPRKTSGALVKKEPTEPANKKSKASEKDDGFSMPSATIPDINEVLARDKLQTFIVAKRVQQQINDLENDWNKVAKDVPNQQDLNSYQQRFNQIINGEIKDLADIQQRKKQLENLQDEVKAKIKNVEKGKNLFAEKLPQIQKDALALKTLPAQDLAGLQSRYSLDQKGFSNVTKLLYGNKIQGYVEQAQYWYNKAKPYLDNYQSQQAEEAKEIAKAKAKRILGVDVHYQEYDPEPDFIIKKILVSSLISWGNLGLDITNVNFDQPTSKMPIKFIAKLKPTGQKVQLDIVGQSNFIEKGKGFHVANIKMDNYKIKDWSLADGKELPVMMKTATNQVRGKLTLLENEKISGKVTLGYNRVDFDLSRTDSTSVKRYIAPIFDDITSFKVVSDIEGKLFSPKIGAKSDLDKKLSKAFNKVLGKEIKQAKSKLKKEFNSRVAKELEPINKKLSSLVGEQVAVGKDYNKLQGIMQKKSSQYVDEQKEKLKEKAQAKLDAKRKEAEAKIQREKEKERKRQKNKLKKKPKKLF